jgi:hypothetical protein
MLMNDIRRKIEHKEKKLHELQQLEKNMIEFVERYSDLICGHDGIFGVLCDEILLNILSYLTPNELLLPPCRRFRALTLDALRISTGQLCANMDRIIYNNMIKYLFRQPLYYYCYFYYHKYGIKLSNNIYKLYKKDDMCIIKCDNTTRKVTQLGPAMRDRHMIEYNNNSNNIRVSFTSLGTFITYIRNDIVTALITINNDGDAEIDSTIPVVIRSNCIIKMDSLDYIGNKCLFIKSSKHHVTKCDQKITDVNQ